MKGTFLLMATGQFYNFVGFYGFYQVKNFKGFQKFGMKINFLATIFVLFLYLFFALGLFPILYYWNSNDHLLRKTS